jgi:hypothetical protein
MFSDILNLMHKWVKNLGQRSTKLFTSASSLCKNHWSKHPSAFVKVVEGSEIYNFAYCLLGYLTWKFLRKTQLKNVNPKQRTPPPEVYTLERATWCTHSECADVVDPVSWCDAPGFYLTIIVGQLCWQWSNHGQPGSSPRKPHQPTLMTL